MFRVYDHTHGLSATLFEVTDKPRGKAEAKEIAILWLRRLNNYSNDLGSAGKSFAILRKAS